MPQAKFCDSIAVQNDFALQNKWSFGFTVAWSGVHLAKWAPQAKFLWFCSAKADFCYWEIKQNAILMCARSAPPEKSSTISTCLLFLCFLQYQFLTISTFLQFLCFLRQAGLTISTICYFNETLAVEYSNLLNYFYAQTIPMFLPPAWSLKGGLNSFIYPVLQASKQ